jgi:hypothetical protein
LISNGTWTKITTTNSLTTANWIALIHYKPQLDIKL